MSTAESGMIELGAAGSEPIPIKMLREFTASEVFLAHIVLCNTWNRD